MTSSRSVDAAEIKKFSDMAQSWWDPAGDFKPLHQLNPLRIRYILDKSTESRAQSTIKKKNLSSELRALCSSSLLDIGCGGGLLSEPFARLGAQVTAIDASAENIAEAQLHAKGEGLKIDYRCMTAEELLKDAEKEKRKVIKKTNTEHRTPNAAYDIVLAMEIIEHVADVPSFIETCCQLVKPGGLLFFSTLNRTVKSYALGIVSAEYLLRWVPPGTHDWKKFLRPSEIVHYAEKSHMKLKHLQGVSYRISTGEWELSDDLGVNYMMVLEKTL